jgi:hypothetical protein
MLPRLYVLLLQLVDTLLKLLKVAWHQSLSDELEDVDVFVKQCGLVDPELEAILIRIKVGYLAQLVILPVKLGSAVISFVHD